jgi:hypothetical protein
MSASNQALPKISLAAVQTISELRFTVRNRLSIVKNCSLRSLPSGASAHCPPELVGQTCRFAFGAANEPDGCHSERAGRRRRPGRSALPGAVSRCARCLLNSGDRPAICLISTCLMVAGVFTDRSGRPCKLTASEKCQLEGLESNE